MSNNSGNSPSNPSEAQGNGNGRVRSKCAIVKEGWGSRPNFQRSHGLGSMGPTATFGSWCTQNANGWVEVDPEGI